MEQQGVQAWVERKASAWLKIKMAMGGDMYHYEIRLAVHDRKIVFAHQGLLNILGT